MILLHKFAVAYRVYFHMVLSAQAHDLPPLVLHLVPIVPHADGIDEDAGLLVTWPDGTKETITSGEVSVRGMYGYV